MSLQGRLPSKFGWVKGEFGNLRVVDIIFRDMITNASFCFLQTLFGYLGKIQDLNLYPSGPSPEEVDESTPPKECYIMFEELETVGVSLHLNQTSFIDRPLVVAPMHE